MLTVTKEQARRFMLRKQGLLGAYRFDGKRGVLTYVRQAGCIQLDPVDICGKNAELTLQSRVRNFRKEQLEELLYKDRALFDYPDKQLSIIPTENWAYYERYRQLARKGGEQFEGLAALEAEALAFIQANGPVSADTLPLSGKLFWHSSIHWSGSWQGDSNAARSVLEQLYSTGALVIHHKVGTRKCYDLASRHIPAQYRNAPDPLTDDYAHTKWRVLRRIGAAGLVWDRPSGLWNNVWELTTATRHRIFCELTEDGVIAPLLMEGIKFQLYYLSEDTPLLEEVLSGRRYMLRCEFIAPLDSFLWDKELTRTVFNFDYSWEIYTTPERRKFGAYVLPILYGDRFIGRIEAVHDRKEKTLIVRNLWYEVGVKKTKQLRTAVEKRIKAFAVFNNCEEVVYPTEAAVVQKEAEEKDFF